MAIPEKVNYKKVSIGRMAVFFLPTHSLGKRLDNGDICSEYVEQFLENAFQGFTVEGADYTGFWVNEKGKRYEGLYTKYRVSFKGKERVQELDEFLSYIGQQLEQESVYVETGEDAFLIYPDSDFLSK